MGQKPDRPAVSGSMAGHCRMEIWIAAHAEFLQAEPEPVMPHSQRTFDLGHIVEAMIFDGLMDAAIGDLMAPWWPEIGVITNHLNGETIDTKEWRIVPWSRQYEVEVDGVVGHIDAIIEHEPTKIQILADAKTMPSLTWDRNIRGDLNMNPFSREYVFQLNHYLEGLRLRSHEMQAGILLLFNKENSKVAYREVQYDSAVIAEGRERLSWAKSEIAPEPDYQWEKGKDIPLRCGYCQFRLACSKIRQQPIQLHAEKGVPKWKVS